MIVPYKEAPFPVHKLCPRTFITSDARRFPDRRVFLCPKTRLFPPCLTDITGNTCQCCQKHHKKDDAKGQELRFRHLPLFHLTAQICQQTKHHAADGTENTHCPAHFLFIIFCPFFSGRCTKSRNESTTFSTIQKTADDEKQCCQYQYTNHCYHTKHLQM